jgi:hypothetical protein
VYETYSSFLGEGQKKQGEGGFYYYNKLKMSETKVLDVYTYGVILKEKEGEIDDDRYTITFDGKSVVLPNNAFEFHSTVKLTMNDLFDKVKGTKDIDSVYFFTSDKQRVDCKITSY